MSRPESGCLSVNDRPARDYFSAAQQAFEKAAVKAGEIRLTFRLGDGFLCLRFAGPALVERLTRAMRHIECPLPDGVAADLTVNCFDSITTGTLMPPPTWPATAYGVKGHIENYNTADHHTLYQPGIDILNLYERSTATGLYWVEKAETIPYWEASFPMRGMVHWWSREKPLQLMHAGAVGLPEGGVLLAGKSGSGKSTSALACLAGGLDYVSDDYIMADVATPYVYSMYSTAKLVPENTARFPAFEKMISNPAELQQSKALIYLYEHFPKQISAGFPVKAILMPRVTGLRDTSLSPAKASASLFALAPTTVMHLEGHSKLAFEKTRDLVQQLPHYWLNSGTDLMQIPQTIRNFLEKGA